MRELIGIPWAVPCDPPHSFDCWELVRYVRAKYNRPTPSYVDRINRTPSDRKLIETPPEGWYRLLTPNPLCVVRIGDKHVGLYLSDYQILHAQMGSGVRIDPLTTMRLSGNVTYWEYS